MTAHTFEHHRRGPGQAVYWDSTATKTQRPRRSANCPGSDREKVTPPMSTHGTHVVNPSEAEAH